MFGSGLTYLAGIFVKANGATRQILDIETVLGAGRGAGDDKGQGVAIGTGGGRDSAGIGQRDQFGACGKKLGVSGGDDFGGDGQGFFPGVVAIFFDLNLVFARVEVESVVGGGSQVAVDIDLGRGRKRVGREEARTFDDTGPTQAVAFGVADHEVSADEHKQNGGKKYQGAEDVVTASHRGIIAQTDGVRIIYSLTLFDLGNWWQALIRVQIAAFGDH